jgi:hypothetical protein
MTAPKPHGPPWRPCPTCWGQRQLWRQGPDGLEPEPCPTCLGLGDVPSVPSPEELARNIAEPRG